LGAYENGKAAGTKERKKAALPLAYLDSRGF
jgi:hypothetical protein